MQQTYLVRISWLKLELLQDKGNQKIAPRQKFGLDIGILLISLNIEIGAAGLDVDTYGWR